VFSVVQDFMTVRKNPLTTEDTEVHRGTAHRENA
jgi:hypothetical protein